MDELDRAAAHHFRGLVAENGAGARADLDEIAGGIRHQDEVLRGLEDALAFLDLLMERLLRELALGDVARGLGGADDPARSGADRRDAERDVHVAPALVQAQCFELVYVLAAPDAIAGCRSLRSADRTA